MGKNSRFAVAVHVLTLLAYEGGKALTSDYIAGSVNTNPVVIRRVLGLLVKARIVRTTEGAGGGATLVTPPNEITLVKILRAVEQGEFFMLPPNDPNPRCPVGRSVQAILGQRLDEFQEVIEQALSRVTVADLLADVKAERRQ
jgi:Rrf2 family protein